LKIVVIALVLLVAATGTALVYGARRWHASTRNTVARLEASRLAPRNAIYDESELRKVPEPVAGYFRTVLRPGQALITGVRMVQEGQFRTGESEDTWRPFHASQVFLASPPGFVWDARIRMAPGVNVYVRDAYLAGATSMRGEILGLIPVVDAQGRPELAAGALQRYLAEAMWFPTRLLPSQGIRWDAIDDSSALATLTDGLNSVSLEFRFNPKGGIAGVYTPSRFREARGTYLPTPWEARSIEHAERDGMRIPVVVEVAWHLAEGRRPYWRGRVTEVVYQYARLPGS
jgi:hypothetical protein